MAEFILSPLLEVISGHLASPAMEEIRLVWGVDEELNNLKSTLSAIQAVLEDAEERQSQSNAVKNWLEKLQDVAYDADDLVDEMATEAQQSIVQSRTDEPARKKMKVLNFLPSWFGSSSSQLSYRREMAHRIKEIHEKLDKISKEKEAFHLQTRPASKQSEIREGRRQLVSSVRDESEVFGRQKDLDQIIESLSSKDSSRRRKFSVISIVGMGGLGKTALAQLVYNDDRIISAFDLRAWVCVSEDFDIIRLTKEIIESAGGSSWDLSSIDALHRRLQQILNGKRFLLVLDDVWNENSSYWDQLQGPFASGAPGSKILVTTRSQPVSAVMQASWTHNLEVLSVEDCWALFKSRAFVHDAEEDINAYRHLVEIGRKLVEKCQGLPLAAKALGSLLCSTRDEREWENILESKTWDLHGQGGEILPALRLSYQYLPPHLKRCFTFCSVFEKDHEFKQEELVKMWIAHGFVRGKDGEQIEDTGSRYFNDLMQRSFFQSSFRYYFNIPFKSSQQYYTMHDLVHDLAQSISGDECFYADGLKQLHDVPPRKVRHLSLMLTSDEDLSNFEAIYKMSSLRTLFLSANRLSARGGVNVPNEIFNHLKLLTVLTLWNCNTSGFIGNLRHLRYLRLRDGFGKKLLDSPPIKLPNETRELINLRHLQLGWSPALKSMPAGIGQLSCLQTLPLFIVGREQEGGIAELKNLTHLRGSLVIANLERVEEAKAARQANLKSKPFINDLELYWSYRDPASSIDERLEEEVAEGLQPYPNLKKISFYHYMGTRFPSWMMKMGTDVLFSNLTRVVLDGCRKCSTLPPLGQLPCLAELYIKGIDEVKQIEEGQFLCLRRLRIYDCPQLIFLPRFPSLEELRTEGLHNLEDWCGVGEADFPNLGELMVENCPKLTKWPTNLSVLTDLSVSNCQGLDSFPLLPSLRSLSVKKSSDKLWNSVSCLTSVTHLNCLGLQLTAAHRGILQTLTQLKSLFISDCDKLETLLGEGDSSLQQRQQQHNAGLSSTLTHLYVSGCRNLKSLPRDLHALTSLQHLQIWNCPQVASLPEEGLPIGLQKLYIFDCPELKERCRKDTGEDWPKISSIPHLTIS